MVITKSLNGTEETFKVEGRLDTLAAPALLDELEQIRRPQYLIHGSSCTGHCI